MTVLLNPTSLVVQVGGHNFRVWRGNSDWGTSVRALVLLSAANPKDDELLTAELNAAVPILDRWRAFDEAFPAATNKENLATP